jgi:hypothetical protein
MSAVNKLQKVLNGELDFYFSFESIQLFKGDTLLTVLNENNCDNSRAVFKRGGLYGGVFAAFDVMDDDTWGIIQSFGAFRGMYSGFNFCLDLHGWRTNTNTPFSIIYPLYNGGLDTIMLIAAGDRVNMQIDSQDFSLVLVG